MFDSTFDWRDGFAFLSFVVLASGLVVAWIRWRLSDDFARKADISGIGTRLEEVERRMAGMPTHSDLRQLSDRVAAVERGVDVVGTEIRGVNAALNRVERDLSLLVQHHIKTGT